MIIFPTLNCTVSIKVGNFETIAASRTPMSFTHFSHQFSQETHLRLHLLPYTLNAKYHSPISKENISMETVGERHFVPRRPLRVGRVSESATNLYLPHPGLRRDHYQSFLLNCGSARV